MLTSAFPTNKQPMISRILEKAPTIAALGAVMLLPAFAPRVDAAEKEFQEGELTAANYEKWREHVLPRNCEISYRFIPWRTSYWEAVVEAQERDRPILLRP